MPTKSEWIKCALFYFAIGIISAVLIHKEELILFFSLYLSLVFIIWVFNLDKFIYLEDNQSKLLSGMSDDINDIKKKLGLEIEDRTKQQRLRTDLAYLEKEISSKILNDELSQEGFYKNVADNELMNELINKKFKYEAKRMLKYFLAEREEIKKEIEAGMTPEEINEKYEDCDDDLGCYNYAKKIYEEKSHNQDKKSQDK